MARTLDGVDDAILTDLTTYAPAQADTTRPRTWIVWFKRPSSSDLNARRLWDKDNGREQLWWQSSLTSNGFRMERQAATNRGQWAQEPPTFDAWHCSIFSLDDSVAGNTPETHSVDADETYSEVQTPSGDYFRDGANPYIIGNRDDRSRSWEGQLAEFVIYDGFLTAQQKTDIRAGRSPMAVLDTSRIVRYHRLKDDNVSDPDLSGNGTAATYEGTVWTSDHPPVDDPPAEGGSWSFDGVDDSLEIALNAAVQTPTTNVTLGGWFKITGTEGFAVVAGVWDSYRIQTRADTTTYRSVINANTAGTRIDTTHTSITGNWCFFAFTMEAGVGMRQRIWDASGTLLQDVSSGNSYTITYGTHPFRVMETSGGSANAGKAAYVGAHNAVLSDTDLNTWRTTGIPPVTFSVAFLPLDSSIATDTAQGNPLIVSGAVYDSVDGPPVTAAGPSGTGAISATAILTSAGSAAAASGTGNLSATAAMSSTGFKGAVGTAIIAPAALYPSSTLYPSNSLYITSIVEVTAVGTSSSVSKERMVPDAILELTNLTGQLSYIQDDPDAADADWLVLS